MFNVCGSQGSATDIIVVIQPDGTLCCSAMNVRFRDQKDVANREKKIVFVHVNGQFVLKLSLNELNPIKSDDGGFRFTPSCLEKMQLHPELNDITFTMELHGRDVEAKAHMFLWRWDARIVITDVDGTITKSDKRGIFMRLFGCEWNRDGVCHLFSTIHDNGYKLVYLTARPIYEAEATRDLLDDMKQENETVPKGPVIVSPDGYIAAFFREVVTRTQDKDFKTPTLKQIRKLFPDNANPFYAGFGNRSSDGRAYLELEIPCTNIFHLSRKKFMGRRAIQVKCREDKCREEKVFAIFFGEFKGFSIFVHKFFPKLQDCAASHQSQTFPRRAKNYLKSLLTRTLKSCGNWCRTDSKIVSLDISHISQ